MHVEVTRNIKSRSTDDAIEDHSLKLDLKT